MANTIEIPKCNEKLDNFPCWIPVMDESGNKSKPYIKCKCGRVTNIGLHHVHSDGRVTASYYHNNPPQGSPYGGCGWHVYLKLKDWTGEEYKPVK